MNWSEFWAIFVQSTTQQKAHLWNEIMGEDWMKNLSSRVQFDVLKDAPMEVLTVLKLFPEVFKHETLVMLGNRVKRLNRRR